MYLNEGREAEDNSGLQLSKSQNKDPLGGYRRGFVQ